MTRASSLRRRTSSFAASAGAPAIIWVFLLFSGAYSAAIFCFGAAGEAASTRADLFLLGRHDALERRVAKLIDAALNRQQRRQRHAPPTETSRPRAPASLEDGSARTCTSMMIVACGMPSVSASTTPVCAEPWSSDCRPVSTRSNCSSPMAPASAAGDHERVGACQGVALDVDGAVGATRQRLAQHLGHARRAGRAHDHFAAVLLLEPQALFERVRVRLVHLERRRPARGSTCRRSSRRGCQSRAGTCLTQNGDLSSTG